MNHFEILPSFDLNLWKMYLGKALLIFVLLTLFTTIPIKFKILINFIQFESNFQRERIMKELLLSKKLFK